jgi:hypothetical protein
MRSFAPLGILTYYLEVSKIRDGEVLLGIYCCGEALVNPSACREQSIERSLLSCVTT